MKLIQIIAHPWQSPALGSPPGVSSALNHGASSPLGVSYSDFLILFLDPFTVLLLDDLIMDSFSVTSEGL